MKEVATFLMEHYYSHYDGPRKDIVPTEEQLLRALQVHWDKVIVIRKYNEVKGVAIFLTLTDETYENIEKYDIEHLHLLAGLLKEQGDNLHFILLASVDIKVVNMVRKAIRGLNPRSVSWWSPDHSRLYRRNLN